MSCPVWRQVFLSSTVVAGTFSVGDLIPDIPEDQMPCVNVTSGLTKSRETNTDSVLMTAFCLTKDELISRFYIKINNGNTFKQIV